MLLYSYEPIIIQSKHSSKPGSHSFVAYLPRCRVGYIGKQTIAMKTRQGSIYKIEVIDPRKRIVFGEKW